MSCITPAGPDGVSHVASSALGVASTIFRAFCTLEARGVLPVQRVGVDVLADAGGHSHRATVCLAVEFLVGSVVLGLRWGQFDRHGTSSLGPSIP